MRNILEGLAESIIVTKVDELLVKAVLDKDRTVSYSGDINLVADGRNERSKHLKYYGGEHLFSSSYKPSQIFVSDGRPVNGPLYVSTIGSMLHYLIGAITQVGGQYGNLRGKQKFGSYTRSRLPQSLYPDSFRNLIKEYARYFNAQKSFEVRLEAIALMEDLERVYMLLRQYSKLITRTHIQNLVLLHDSSFHPVVRLNVTESIATSLREGKSEATVSLDLAPGTPIGYNKLDFTLQEGSVEFSPALASEIMEIEGEFKLKLKGRARRITKRIDTSYKLKGDWEGNVHGRVDIEIGALAYWKRDNVSRPGIKVSFDGSLL